MKYLLILLLFPVVTFSQISGEFNIGYSTVDLINFTNDVRHADKTNSMYTKLDLNYGFKLFNLDNKLNGNIKTWASQTNTFNYAPFRVIYSVSYQIDYKDYLFRVQQYCNHPVFSGVVLGNNTGIYDGTEIIIGIKW